MYLSVLRFCLGVVIAIAAGSITAFATEETQSIPIETGVAQLFVDDFLIDTQSDLVRTLHQPKKDTGGNLPEIQLPPDAFGGHSFTLQGNGSIVHDVRNQCMVCFAIAYCGELINDKERSWEKVRLYRFTSNDGMAWSGGERVFPRSKRDFLDPESGKYASNMDLFSCYYDAKDADYPYKGWMWYANWGDELEGIHYVQSKDGSHWERGKKIIDGCGSATDTSMRKIEQDGRTLVGAGDVTTFYYDKASGKYLALIKFTSPDEVGPKNRLRSRAYAFVDRLDEPFDLHRIDHVDLVPAAEEKNGDLPHDEYYASTAWRYQSLWLGGLKIWHGGGDYPYSAAGSAFLKLVVSRDGLHWEKVPFKNDDGIPEVWVPNGAEGGNGGKNDGGYLTEPSTGPFVSGSELIYYYGCSSYGKNHPTGIRLTGGGIFRARLRIDGFVSMNGGSLTTKPLAFTGKHLTVNSVGPVHVELLSADKKDLGSTLVNGDSLQHDVFFNGKSLSQVTNDGKMRLKFTALESGRLYSFTVR